MARSNRAETAAKAAALRAEAARKERQQKQLVAAAVGVVVVIIAVAIGYAISSRPSTPEVATGGDAALTKLTAIPAATFDAYPAGSPQQAPALLQDGAPLGTDSKPEVFYVGADFCPFCAIERWALIGTLSRFGEFENLGQTTSSSTHVHPDTPTYTFHGSTFTSDYVTFRAVETADREGNALEQLSAEDEALFRKHQPDGSIPWITFNGTHAIAGANVQGAAFEGKTYDEIIAGILDPQSELGQTVGPAMNLMTAQICADNGNQPENVCTAPAVVSAATLLQR